MTQSLHSPASREALTDTIMDAKLRKNLTFEQINEGTGLSLGAVEPCPSLASDYLPRRFYYTRRRAQA